MTRGGEVFKSWLPTNDQAAWGGVTHSGFQKKFRGMGFKNGGILKMEIFPRGDLCVPPRLLLPTAPTHPMAQRPSAAPLTLRAPPPPPNPADGDRSLSITGDSRRGLQPSSQLEACSHSPSPSPSSTFLPLRKQPNGLILKHFDIGGGQLVLWSEEAAPPHPARSRRQQRFWWLGWPPGVAAPRARFPKGTPSRTNGVG